MEGMDGMGMDGMGMDGMGMDGMGMDGMGMDGMGMGGMGMAMAGPNRMFPPDANRGASATPKTGKFPAPRLGWFIAGVAAMPHKANVQAYKDAFSQAAGYLPIRDQPMYYNYEIQRAEVTEKTVDQLVEADWVSRGDRTKQLFIADRQWAGFAPELVPADYRSAITGYIPPVLLDGYAHFSLHPLIPREPRIVLNNIAPADQPGLGQPDLQLSDVELADIGQTGGDFGGMGMGGMEYGGMDMSMDFGGGMGMGMGGMSMVAEVDPVDHKILRFYDMLDTRDPETPLPGRQYVYRLRYSVRDSNFPPSPGMQPKSSTLAPDVYERVRQLIAESLEQKKRVKAQIWSDWSEPGAPVALPSRTQVYAGPVEQPRSRDLDIRGQKVTYSKDEPIGKLVAKSFDLRYQAPMTHWRDVKSGTVLAYDGDVELIDPITLQIKKVPDGPENPADLRTNSTVIDVAGGQTLEITGDEKLAAPGHVLLFDESGKLVVQSEYDAQQSYRAYAAADERGL